MDKILIRNLTDEVLALALSAEPVVFGPGESKEVKRPTSEKVINSLADLAVQSIIAIGSIEEKNEK